MSFIENILVSLGGDLNLMPLSYRGVLFGDQACYFEGVKGIKSYEKTEIILLIKKGSLIITGKELIIKKYCAGDALLTGQISNIEVKND